MDLVSYIREVGNDRAAKTLKVKPRRILAWRYGVRRPRPEKAIEIEKLTGGVVTFKEIYSPKQ